MGLPSLPPTTPAPATEAITGTGISSHTGLPPHASETTNLFRAPEPSTGALIAIGVGLVIARLAIFRRRLKRW